MLSYVAVPVVFLLFVVSILMSFSLPAQSVSVSASDQVGTSTGSSSPNQLKDFLTPFPNQVGTSTGSSSPNQLKDFLTPFLSQVAGSGHSSTNSQAVFSGDPLVDTFANVISQHFLNNPERSEAFGLANLPGSMAGGLFRNVLFRNFQGNPMASILADISSWSVASTFDFFNPAQLPLLVGYTMGKFLMKRGLLTPENVSSLAATIASDIWNTFQALKAVDNEGYLQTIFFGCCKFLMRFGYNAVDHAAEITEYFVSGLGLLANGV